MGGLGPGIGGLEYVVIGLVALLVLGPERLPLMMRKVGQWVGKARAMAAEFRSSFDEMARQSELDELRKEVEALRTHQGMHRLGADADAAFREIRDDLNTAAKPAAIPAAQPTPVSPDAWTEGEAPRADPVAPAQPSAIPAAKAKPKASKPKAASSRKTTPKPRTAAKPRAKSEPKTTTKAKPASRKPAARKPKA